MNANELMIGDWVKYGNEYFQVDGYFRITNTLFLKYNGHTAHYEDGCVVAEDSEPIPLTAEILENNGWKDSDPNLFNGLHYVFIYGKNHTLTLNHWTNSNTNEEYYTIALCGGDRVLKYVHELQRALRCCGLFDLADNFKVPA